VECDQLDDEGVLKRRKLDSGSERGESREEPSEEERISRGTEVTYGIREV